MRELKRALTEYLGEHFREKSPPSVFQTCSWFLEQHPANAFDCRTGQALRAVCLRNDGQDKLGPHAQTNGAPVVAKNQETKEKC